MDEVSEGDHDHGKSAVFFHKTCDVVQDKTTVIEFKCFPTLRKGNAGRSVIS